MRTCTDLLDYLSYILHLYDMDTIEETNIAGQLYHIDDVEETKVDATKKRLQLYSGNTSIYTYEEYKKESLRDQYMFSCFDNLDARKIMFENWLTIKDDDKIFIDGRMSLTTFDVFFVTPDKIEKYREDLYSDIKIEPLNCNLKATSHCGATAAYFTDPSNRKYKKGFRKGKYKIAKELADVVPLLRSIQSTSSLANQMFGTQSYKYIKKN